jgi:hypothetical protein
LIEEPVDEDEEDMINVGEQSRPEYPPSDDDFSDSDEDSDDDSDEDSDEDSGKKFVPSLDDL